MLNWLKSLFRLCPLHYYGVPHRNRAGILVQTCYECSKDKVVEWNLN